MTFRDYYAILGLPFGATPEQIERAYKLLVRMSHPDAFPNNPEAQAWANERMKQIHEAYETLSDPGKRADYDRTYRRQAEDARRKEQAHRDSHEARVRCPLCEGTGRTTCLTCRGQGERSCPGCAGERIVVCPICQGVGTLSQAEYDHLRREAGRAERQSREAAARAEEGRRQAEIARQAQSQRTRKVAGAGVSLVVLVFLARGCLVSSPQTAQVSTGPSAVATSGPLPASTSAEPLPPPPRPSEQRVTTAMIVERGGDVFGFQNASNVSIGRQLMDWVIGLSPGDNEMAWATFRLDRQWDRFEAYVGLADKASDYGRSPSAYFFVFLDGHEAFRTLKVQLGELREVSLSVKDVKAMQLRIEHYGMASVHAMGAVFAEPRLIRESP